MPKNLTLTPELLRELLEYDPETGILYWKRRGMSYFKSPRIAKAWNTRYAGQEAGSIDTAGYISLSIMGTYIRGHRAAWAIHYGVFPDHCDHDDGCRSNNRLLNLNDVTKGGNQKNQKRSAKNTTGATGVYRHGERWTAQITSGGVTIHLGVFNSFEAARDARKTAGAELGFNPNHGRHK